MPLFALQASATLTQKSRIGNITSWLDFFVAKVFNTDGPAVFLDKLQMSLHRYKGQGVNAVFIRGEFRTNVSKNTMHSRLCLSQ